jgi:hypothetical protein
MAFEYVHKTLGEKPVVVLDDVPQAEEKERKSFYLRTPAGVAVEKIIEGDTRSQFKLEIVDGTAYIEGNEAVYEFLPVDKKKFESFRKEHPAKGEQLETHFAMVGGHFLVNQRQIYQERFSVDLEDPLLKGNLLLEPDGDWRWIVIQDSGKILPGGKNYYVKIGDVSESQREALSQLDVDVPPEAKRVLDDMINGDQQRTVFKEIDDVLALAKICAQQSIDVMFEFLDVPDKPGKYCKFAPLNDPRFERYDKTIISNILSVLMAINPPDEDYEQYISKITEDTSSLFIGNANERIFKISDDEDVIKKEVYVMRKLAGYAPLAGMVQRLSLTLDDPDLEGRLETLALTEEEREGVVAARETGYISLGGLYVLVSESEERLYKIPEGGRVTPREYNVVTNSLEAAEMDALYIFHLRPVFDEIINIMNPEMGKLKEEFDDWVARVLNREGNEGNTYRIKDGLKRFEQLLDFQLCLSFNKMLDRLYTLALLHGKFTKTFTQQEKDIVGAPDYEDFLPLDVKQCVEKAGRTIDDNLLETYLDVSMRQRKIHKDRKEGEQSKEEPLVFTHGDAKYDNWFGRVLGDFGSCKFSTEYKDVAKALLDSAHHRYRTIEDKYIEFLKDASMGSGQEAFMRKANIPECIEQGSVSPEFGRIIQRFQDGKIDFEGLKAEQAELIRRTAPQVPETAVIDDYIDIYLFMREATGSPVVESNESFKRNIHEALLTESVRTIYYKAPMPEKKKVVDQMMDVATQYADLARKRRV